MNFDQLSEETFDRDLAFARSAIDLPAIAKPGPLFGGNGRYSPAWEHLLDFCFWPPDRIYAGDERVMAVPVCRLANGAHDTGDLLAAHIPRPGVLTIPHITRIKARLKLTAEQEEHWRAVEAA